MMAKQIADMAASVPPSERPSVPKRYMAYRNFVKALPLLTSVREIMDDPSYDVWFINLLQRGAGQPLAESRAGVRGEHDAVCWQTRRLVLTCRGVVLPVRGGGAAAGAVLPPLPRSVPVALERHAGVWADRPLRHWPRAAGQLSVGLPAGECHR